MTRSVETYVAQLDQWERESLDDPDQLFALSYLRGHIDLLSTQETDTDLLEQLSEQMSSTFEADRLTEADKALIHAQLERLRSL